VPLSVVPPLRVQTVVPLGASRGGIFLLLQSVVVLHTCCWAVISSAQNIMTVCIPPILYMQV
jgi:hypothetical protein